MATHEFITEEGFLGTLAAHEHTVARQVEDWCSARGLRKTPIPCGLAWHHGDGGSIILRSFQNRIEINTNWSTMRTPTSATLRQKLIAMQSAANMGFLCRPPSSPHGGFRLPIAKSTTTEEVGTFIRLAFEVLDSQRQGQLA